MMSAYLYFSSLVELLVTSSTAMNNIFVLKMIAHFEKRKDGKFQCNANQLTIKPMQVQQVTEEVAMAVVDLYPTILSLASAYSLLVSPDSLDFLVVARSCSVFLQPFLIMHLLISKYVFDLGG